MKILIDIEWARVTLGYVVRLGVHRYALTDAGREVVGVNASSVT